MKTAFTPGPWTVGKDGTGFINQVKIDPSIGCAYGRGEEVEANARLIAAAPDLLDACVAYIASREELNLTADSNAVKAIRAAIEKAVTP